jgi:hypothetical protein
MAVTLDLRPTRSRGSNTSLVIVETAYLVHDRIAASAEAGLSAFELVPG